METCSFCKKCFFVRSHFESTSSTIFHFKKLVSISSKSLALFSSQHRSKQQWPPNWIGILLHISPYSNALSSIIHNLSAFPPLIFSNPTPPIVSRKSAPEMRFTVMSRESTFPAAAAAVAEKCHFSTLSFLCVLATLRRNCSCQEYVTLCKSAWSEHFHGFRYKWCTIWFFSCAGFFFRSSRLLYLWLRGCISICIRFSYQFHLRRSSFLWVGWGFGERLLKDCILGFAFEISLSPPDFPLFLNWKEDDGFGLVVWKIAFVLFSQESAGCMPCLWLFFRWGKIKILNENLFTWLLEMIVIWKGEKKVRDPKLNWWRFKKR